MMDFQGVVILGLIVLPFFVIGYACGMLHMRRNYLNLLRWERIEKARAERYARINAEKQRHVGFAVGFREGKRSVEAYEAKAV